MSGLRCIEDKDRWSLHESFVLVTNNWKTGGGILCTRGKKKAGCATGTERDRKRPTLSRAFSLRFLDSSTCVFHAFFRLFHVRFSWVFLRLFHVRHCNDSFLHSGHWQLHSQLLLAFAHSFRFCTDHLLAWPPYVLLLNRSFKKTNCLCTDGLLVNLYSLDRE